MSEIFEFLRKGGVLMAPIFAFSVVALAVFIERIWSLQGSKVIPKDFLVLIRRKISERRAEEALALCEGNPSPMSTVAASGLRHAGKARDVIKEGFEEIGRLEVVQLSRFVEVMGTIAAIAPLMGLLGTVTGMIDVFRTVVGAAGDQAGQVDPGMLASGIWEALLTTAAGLAVAIPVFIGYKYLLARVDRLATEMEEASLELVDLLTDSYDESGSAAVVAVRTDAVPSETA